MSFNRNLKNTDTSESKEELDHITLAKGSTYWLVGNRINLARSAYKNNYHIINVSDEHLLQGIPHENAYLFKTLSAAQENAPRTEIGKHFLTQELNKYLVPTIFEVKLMRDQNAIRTKNGLIIPDTNNLFFVKGGIELDCNMELNFKLSDLQLTNNQYQR